MLSNKRVRLQEQNPFATFLEFRMSLPVVTVVMLLLIRNQTRKQRIFSFPSAEQLTLADFLCGTLKSRLRKSFANLMLLPTI